MVSRGLFISLFIATTFAQPIAAQSLSDGLYHTIQQKSSGLYVDAHNGQHDSAAVLRFVQFNDTQKWTFDPVPGQSDVYTIQQVSNSRYLDAYEQAAQDHGVVTRASQDNDTQRWQLVALGNDEFRLKQQSSNRFLDAYDTSNNDFALVTRGQQDNDTQIWVIKPVELEGSFYIRHKESGRFVDAYETQGDDFSVVHRLLQKNRTQRWKFTPVGNNTYTIQQQSSGRFADAYTNDENGRDYGLVTRTRQNNDTQKWIVTPTGNDTFKIRQKSSGRYIDAYVDAGNDFALVTRPAQSDGSQEWKIIPEIRGTYTIQQKSNERYLDAYLTDRNDNDFGAVTNSNQDNDSQHWLITPLGEDTYTIQHWSNGRFLDAYTNGSDDHRLVTRPLQNNDSQKWKLTYVGGDTYRVQQKANGRFMDAYQGGEDGYAVVTRNQQPNDTQEWLIRRASVSAPGIAYGSSSNMSGQGHASIINAVDDLVLDHLRKNRIPGATVAASVDGRLVLSKGYGFRNVHTEAPMLRTSRTRVGSTSKVLTTMAFMKLTEQKPWLNTEASVYGPNSLLSDPSYMAAIQSNPSAAPVSWYTDLKVNQLLSHTAGLNAISNDVVAAATPGVEDKSELTYEQIVLYNLANGEFKFEPGSVNCFAPSPGQPDCYENYHLGTVGFLISEVSGQPYRDYVKQNILDPLGLTDVVPEDGVTTNKDSAPHVYTHSGTSTSTTAVDPTTTGLAAGGWMASAEDWVRLMTATDKLPNNSDILSPATIDLMESAPYPEISNYAHGWAIACENGGYTTPPCRLGHNGSLTGGRAYITKFKDGFVLHNQDVGNINVAVLFNIRHGDGHRDLAWEIAKIIGAASIPAGYDLFQ